MIDQSLNFYHEKTRYKKWVKLGFLVNPNPQDYLFLREWDGWFSIKKIISYE